MSKINDLASDAAYVLVDQLTSDLRATASAADWPEEIIAQLSVQWDGTSLSVAYPTAIAQEVENLEYGYFSDRPNSVIRSFTYRCAPKIKEVFMNRTMPQLMDLEGMFS